MEVFDSGEDIMDIMEGLKKDHFYKPWMDDVTFLLLETMADVREYFEAALKTSDYIAIDTETDSLNVKKANLVGFSFSYRDNECAYVPLRHEDSPNVPYDDFIEYFKSLIPKTKWVFYNAKYDTEVFYYNGIHMESGKHFEDAMLTVYLHDSNKAQNNVGLKSASNNYLKKQMIKFSELVPKAKDSDEGSTFRQVDTELAKIYAGTDALFTRELYEKFKYVKSSRQKAVYQLETQLIDVVRRMERNGIDIDVNYFLTLQRRMQSSINRISKQIFEDCNKEEGSFNLDSGAQVGKVFFEEMGIPNPYRTATNKFSTNADTMIKLADEVGHPVLLKYKEYKRLQKIMSSYINPFVEDPELQRAHISFKQMHVPTGRFACGGGAGSSHYLNVNVQSIPSVIPTKNSNIKKIDTRNISEEHYYYEHLFEWDDQLLCKGECSTCPFNVECKREEIEQIVCDPRPNIRRGFICRDPNKQLFTIDFSGVELRMVTNITKEPKWLKEFLHGTGDLHTITAMDIFNITDRDKVEKGQRGLGKTVNFGSLYGGGAGTLVRTVNSSPNQDDHIDVGFAKKVLDNFWSGIPVIDNWRKEVWQIARREGAAYTHLGRKRPIPESLVKVKPNMSLEEKKEVSKLNSRGDRAAANHVIQGSSADLMKMAMLYCQREIDKRGWGDKLKILLSIHDELVFECDKDIIFEAMSVMSEKMQVKFKGFDIPFITDIEFSDRKISNWGMTTECRVHTDGNIYPTKIINKAESEGLDVISYLKREGLVDYLPVTLEENTQIHQDFEERVTSSKSEEKSESKNNSEVVSDSSQISLTYSSFENKDDVTFDFGHRMRDVRVASQIVRVKDRCPGNSNIFLLFPNNERYEIKNINRDEFERDYNLFFKNPDG